jgi:hypothetical protein
MTTHLWQGLLGPFHTPIQVTRSSGPRTALCLSSGSMSCKHSTTKEGSCQACTPKVGKEKHNLALVQADDRASIMALPPFQALLQSSLSRAVHIVHYVYCNQNITSPV